MMAITAGGVPGSTFAAWLDSITEGPVDAVQIRDKSLDDRSRLELVRQARALLPTRIVILVNGRAPASRPAPGVSRRHDSSIGWIRT
jgi:thiamine monophosphate synthase